MIRRLITRSTAHGKGNVMLRLTMAVSVSSRPAIEAVEGGPSALIGREVEAFTVSVVEVEEDRVRACRYRSNPIQ